MFGYLFPLALLLTIVFGAGAADAHPCNHNGAAVTQMQMPSAHVLSPERARVDVKAVVSQASSASDGRCHCPSGHAACNAHCLAQCATAVAIAETAMFEFSPARLRIAPGIMHFGAYWTPTADIDPPRPMA
jgi:hypothetical protein